VNYFVEVLVQLAHKIIGLDLSPFSKKVESHCLVYTVQELQACRDCAT